MSKSLLGGILKVAGAGALMYGAYKLYENHKNKEGQDEETTSNTITQGEKTEEEIVNELIEEIKNKPSRNGNDMFNLDLLQIKLAQIKVKNLLK